MIFSHLLKIKHLRKQKAEKQVLQDKKQLTEQQQQLKITKQQLHMLYHNHKEREEKFFQAHQQKAISAAQWHHWLAQLQYFQWQKDNLIKDMAIHTDKVNQLENQLIESRKKLNFCIQQTEKFTQLTQQEKCAVEQLNEQREEQEQEEFVRLSIGK
ncbi:YscO family type III secretion system apparatus protein [Arsenophonus nasoniae]|uniref:Type III secretion protein YscO n=2 Tax=Arsenophonus nasoniae TaxID=638 RepID=D2TXP0_9GAMM|nr:YscO family type III secretion system apparatus protein [Arsenophonus nasoniae]QBY44514.1 Type III secretion protein YscO [Arsenophonus nasoniae]WGM00746.1 YscO family type III secretion system apparatus protein [Arsenophonus nasoniae]WGM04772.1 YscO family type III secretion system apparatus protein [Arsenophonus nasoniae]WGM09872.1 YscO family type III secretion system apparatus protein [Arsenophonus nasoniae]WGM14591.1 YscO family type III secretion system apparatus protein [Arsenophonus